ncbi:MAG TPA: oxidoreductase [Flavobacteriales bacterium]|nr:oxidoreductase [Flavobacteriales bacterium]
MQVRLQNDLQRRPRPLHLGSNPKAGLPQLPLRGAGTRRPRLRGTTAGRGREPRPNQQPLHLGGALRRLGRLRPRRGPFTMGIESMKQLNIWITGASSGIGRACTLTLAGAGHHVLASARSQDTLAELADEAQGLDGSVSTLPCDVTGVASVARCVEWISDRWRGLDVVIPNAGIGYFDPLENAKIEEWHAMVDVNVTGVLNTLHATLPLLLASKGHVVNIGSLAARQVFPNSGIYCATKHAVLAISESLRTEFKGQLAVTTLNPGAVNTPFIDRTTNNELRANYRPQFDVGMTPEYVAEAALFAVESRGKGIVSELTIRPDTRH